MAAEAQTGKVAIPPLAVTAYTTKQSKRKKTEEEKRNLKRTNDDRRNKSRVNLGASYSRWRALRDRLGLNFDSKLAVVLLDSFEKVTSTPIKPGAGLPQPSASSISSGSPDRSDDFAVPGVQQLERAVEDEALQQLDASMTSLDLNAATLEAEVNDITNASIDWLEEEELCDSDSDSDSDYVPPLCVRSGGALGTDINISQYEDIPIEDTVHDTSVMDDTEDEEIEDEPQSEAGMDIIGQSASIAYHCCLKQLAETLHLPFSKCNVKDPYSSNQCQAPGPFKVVVKSRASAAIIEWICSSGHIVWRWNSQPTLKYGMRIGDFMLATNILLSGNNFAKITLMFRFMNLGMVGKNTFHKIQGHYCLDTIEKFWKSKQTERLSHFKEKPQIVALGDGRMDSPGFCAKSCTYTFMENETKEILSMESVDKRHVGRNSSIMEKDAFIKSLDYLLPVLPNLKEVCTDAHVQISSLFAKGKYHGCGILHTFDIWHGSKNLGKKIHQASQKKGCRILALWTKDICNHFWFCAKTTSTYDEFFDMWRGVLHHVTGKHEWALGACHHGPLVDDRDKTWIDKGSEAHEALTEIVLNERWLKVVEKFLTFRSTAELESFHNHILMYAGKRFGFSHRVYEVRTFLAGLDYNHHVHRPALRNANGEVEYKRVFNKKSCQWRLYTLKVEKDYAYIKDLQRAIIQCRISSGKGMPSKMPRRPDDPLQLYGLLPAVPRPSIEELLQTQVSRGIGKGVQQ